MSGVLNLLLAGAASAIKDAYYNLTTLLLNTSSTNGAQNNTFLDSSTNNFTITRNGNTTQGTFTPFSQTGWSNFFNTGYLTVASNAAFDFGSGDATIEAWIYPTTSSQTCGIFDKRSSGGNYSQFPQIALNSGALTILVSYNGSSWAVTINGATPAVNAWSHIALVRNGNIWTLYVNGSSSGTPVTASGSVYASTDSLSIGASTSGGTNPFAGYISNARLVKGSAVYTGAFTPPTAALTAITNTSLLTCQSNRFIDNSTTAAAITPNGTYSVQAFSPFLPTAAYDAAVVGGSGYFDGTGDYLSLSSTSLNLGANDFTIEMWIYAATTARDFVIGSISNAAGLGAWMIMLNDSQPIRFFCRYNTGTVLDYQVGSGTFPINQWIHLAITRNGANLRIFQNGTQVGTTNTTLSTFSIDNAITNYYVASSSDPSEFYTGYLSGTRLLVGTALYTTTFTPPTAPPTAITNTTLLLNYTNSGIFDSTAKNVLETVGNAQVSTTQAKWGTTSMYFDGTGDYLRGNANLSNSVAFGKSDFTIELWVYCTSISAGTSDTIIDARPGASTGDSFLFYLWDGGKIAWFVPSLGNYIVNTGAVSANTWTHVAICRSGSTLRSFKDGVLQQSGTDNVNYMNPGSPYPFIGSAYFSGDSFRGYMDDLRISRYARYTANFTPPAAAFPLQ
jgi:hypothetical protein